MQSVLMCVGCARWEQRVRDHSRPEHNRDDHAPLGAIGGLA